MAKNRQSAVAGLFYDDDPVLLDKQLTQLFDTVRLPLTNKNPLAIIVPHAGIIYSGQVAAAGYKQIVNPSLIKNVFIIGISHRFQFSSASVYNLGNYESVFGEVEVNKRVADDLISSCELINYHSEAHVKEHCIEIQLPFLVHLFKDKLRIVPMLIGFRDNTKCMQLAKCLEPYFNSDNLFVISTDFSHYPSKSNASKVDDLTCKAICENNSEKLLRQLVINSSMNINELHTSLCGEMAVLTLLELTKNRRDLEYKPLMYLNSGHALGGDKSHVVGYYSIAVFPNDETDFVDSDASLEILNYIRLKLKQLYGLPHEAMILNESGSWEKQKHGLFISLYNKTELRGCIGRFNPDELLPDLISILIKQVAQNDYRFPPVTKSEVDDIIIELSILSEMRKIADVSEIIPGKHGVFVRKDNKHGTYLPQVASKNGWSGFEFVEHCAIHKAGLRKDEWLDSEIFIYEAIVISE